jgi:cation:H+ antiporter
MEAMVLAFVSDAHLVVLFLVMAVSLAMLVKGADLLVEEAVALSTGWGMSKMLVGATIVSLGTTLPETAVSVYAAIRGSPGLALGNAVGSVIVNAGLILGLAVIIGPVPVDRYIVRRQSWIQFASALLLVAASIPVLQPGTMFTAGGRVPRLAGFVFLFLLVLYVLRSIRLSRGSGGSPRGAAVLVPRDKGRPVVAMLKLLVGIVLIVISSQLLIPTVEIIAERWGIPDSIIAATLVALGTSLPEMATAITAVRRRHGELALGNVIGANILNVLFVVGASTAVTPGGLAVPPKFYVLFYPSLIFIVIVLRIGIGRSPHELKRGFGVVLLAAYTVTVVAGYLVPGMDVSTSP